MNPLQSFDVELRLLEQIHDQAARLLGETSSPRSRECLKAIQQAADSVKVALLNRFPTAPPPSLSPMLRILLVEDNQLTQKLLTRLLEQRGHRVTPVLNGVEALRTLDHHAFDLALMDLRMPGMDGWQTADAIRKRESDQGGRLPIIAVTALNGPDERQRAMDCGMDGFHGKPVRADDLFSEIERVLQRGQDVSPPSPPPIQAVQVDVDRLLQSVDGDVSLLREVVDLYRTDAPLLLERIQSGIQQGIPPQVREAAHSLKGATGAFGKNLVYELAFALEQAGQAGELERAEELFPQLNAAMKQMNAVLERTLAELGA